MSETRTRRYSASRGGHAPHHLSGALLEAVDRNRREWWGEFGDPMVLDWRNQQQQAWWDGLDPKARGRWLTGQLWNCTDTLGSLYCEWLGIPQGSTFAQLARMLRAELG